MPHTQSRYMQDLGFPDGKIFLGPGDINVLITGGTAPLTRNALGDYSYNLAVSSTVVVAINIAQAILRRLGMFEDLQEQFGSQAGTGIAASAQPQAYRPDQIPAMGAGQQLQPRTAFKTKGFRLLSFDTIYLIAGAVLTTNTLALVTTKFANNVANSIVNVVAAAANGLQTATQANPYVTTFALTSAQQNLISNQAGGIPGYLIGQDTSLWLEYNLATGAGGTARFYGVDVAFEYNNN